MSEWNPEFINALYLSLIGFCGTLAMFFVVPIVYRWVAKHAKRAWGWFNHIVSQVAVRDALRDDNAMLQEKCIAMEDTLINNRYSSSQLHKFVEKLEHHFEEFDEGVELVDLAESEEFKKHKHSVEQKFECISGWVAGLSDRIRDLSDKIDENRSFDADDHMKTTIKVETNIQRRLNEFKSLDDRLENSLARLPDILKASYDKVDELVEAYNKIDNRLEDVEISVDNLKESLDESEFEFDSERIDKIIETVNDKIECSTKESFEFNKKELNELILDISGVHTKMDRVENKQRDMFFNITRLFDQNSSIAEVTGSRLGQIEGRLKMVDSLLEDLPQSDKSDTIKSELSAVSALIEQVSGKVDNNRNAMSRHHKNLESLGETIEDKVDLNKEKIDEVEKRVDEILSSKKEDLEEVDSTKEFAIRAESFLGIRLHRDFTEKGKVPVIEFLNDDSFFKLDIGKIGTSEGFQGKWAIKCKKSQEVFTRSFGHELILILCSRNSKEYAYENKKILASKDHVWNITQHGLHNLSDRMVTSYEEDCMVYIESNGSGVTFGLIPVEETCLQKEVNPVEETPKVPEGKIHSCFIENPGAKIAIDYEEFGGDREFLFTREFSVECPEDRRIVLEFDDKLYVSTVSKEESSNMAIWSVGDSIFDNLKLDENDFNALRKRNTKRIILPSSDDGSSVVSLEPSNPGGLIIKSISKDKAHIVATLSEDEISHRIFCT